MHGYRIARICLTLLLGIGAVARAESEAVSIPGGSFRMGTEAARIPELKEHYSVGFPGAFENEAPPRSVTLSSFRLDRHEVSYERYARFLEARPEWRRDRLDADHHNGDYLTDWEGASFPEGKESHPVVFVTWHAALSFCRWAGGRLPSEAEWEYAARAGDDREFPWGNEPPTPERANYYADGIRETTPVGSYPANDFGLHDLAGNVWEWLLDVWVDTPASGSTTDPIAGGAPGEGSLLELDGRRSVRGASATGSVVNIRTRWRDSHVVTNAVGFVGFRCAYPAS